MLLEKNELPESTYRARRMLCPLSMEAEKILVCRNDCILFRGEHVILNKCPKYMLHDTNLRPMRFSVRKMSQ
jgi:hypothetical protein